MKVESYNYTPSRKNHRKGDVIVVATWSNPKGQPTSIGIYNLTRGFFERMSFDVPGEWRKFRHYFNDETTLMVNSTYLERYVIE